MNTPLLLTLPAVEVFLGGLACMEGHVEVPKGSNAGPGVEAIQRDGGGKKGDAWCLHAMVAAGRRTLKERFPLPRTGSCDEVLRWARAKGVLEPTWETGDVGLLLRTEDDAIHAFAVRGASGRTLRPGPLTFGAPFATWEGNTNDDGSREGYRFMARHRGDAHDVALDRGYTYAFIRWTRLLTVTA